MLPPLLLLALLAARGAAAGDEKSYPFSDADEFADFTVVSGRWAVSAGCLACASKGDADEVEWRRRLDLPATVELGLASRGGCTLRVADEGAVADVTIDRAAGRFTVHQGDKVLRESWFVASRTGVLDVVVEVGRGTLAVRVGDDERQEVPLGTPLEGRVRLALLSHRDQARFTSLLIRRASRAEDQGGAGQDGRESEDSRLHREDATRLVDEGRYREAFAVARPHLPAEAAREQVSGEWLRLANRLVLGEPRLRREEPLARWLEETRCASRDGTVSVQTPLDRRWSATAPLARRVDGELLELACAAAGVKVTVYRYDQRVEYWFGEQPRTLFVPGGAAPELAKARFADFLVELPEARAVEAPHTLPRVPGRPAMTAFTVRHAAADGAGEWELREVHAVHRGNAHRLTIEGAPERLSALAPELSWILETWSFHEP